MRDYDSVKDELNRASTLLVDVRQAFERGHDFDLTEFNEVLASACQAAVKLPYDDVRLVRPSLRRILDDLEQLKQLLGADMSAETPDGDVADAG